MRQRELATVLNYINRFRAATGLEPLTEIPKGLPRSRNHCPVAVGLNHHCHVSRSTVKFGYKREYAATLAKISRKIAWGEDVSLPKVVTKFIIEFDHGKLPQFDERVP